MRRAGASCLLAVLPALAALLAAGCGSGSSENPVVVIETNHGTIKAELYPEQAPGTVKNFLEYVDEGHYDGTTFHRVIEGFMIQGGNRKPGGGQKPTNKPIRNESDNALSNKRGTLAMARTDAADSATDEFFINVVNNDRLDRANAPDKVGYCVFGKVIEGMDVVDKIKKVRTAEDVPAKDVVIESIRRDR